MPSQPTQLLPSYSRLKNAMLFGSFIDAALALALKPSLPGHLHAHMTPQPLIVMNLHGRMNVNNDHVTLDACVSSLFNAVCPIFVHAIAR